MLDENEFLTRPYREEPVDRQAEDMVEEIHRSNYVMVDFGFPGGGATHWTPSIPREGYFARGPAARGDVQLFLNPWCLKSLDVKTRRYVLWASRPFVQRGISGSATNLPLCQCGRS
jgi:hypothetical protein